MNIDEHSFQIELDPTSPSLQKRIEKSKSDENINEQFSSWDKGLGFLLVPFIILIAIITWFVKEYYDTIINFQILSTLNFIHFLQIYIVIAVSHQVYSKFSKFNYTLK